MLGKLIKYEWKGLRFPLMIMMIVLAGTMILTCGVILTINPKLDETLAWYSVMALMLSIFLYYFGIIGCTLGTTLIVVVRFYKTCYTDQGYLTHTLPVTPHQLLNSKILTAIFTQLLMIFAIILSIFIILQVGIHHVFSFIPDYSYAELRHEFSIVFADILDSFEDEFGLRLGLYIAYLLFYWSSDVCSSDLRESMRQSHRQCAVWLCIAGTALCETPHCRCDCRILSLAVCHDDHRIYHSHSYVHQNARGNLL